MEYYVITGQLSRYSDGLYGRCRIPDRSTQRPDQLWGTLGLLSNGYRAAVSPVLKLPGREADHSRPSSADVKDGGAMITFKR
jgi:hypothetical protein